MELYYTVRLSRLVITLILSGVHPTKRLFPKMISFILELIGVVKTIDPVSEFLERSRD